MIINSSPQACYRLRLDWGFPSGGRAFAERGARNAGAVGCMYDALVRLPPS